MAEKNTKNTESKQESELNPTVNKKSEVVQNTTSESYEITNNVKKTKTQETLDKINESVNETVNDEKISTDNVPKTPRQKIGTDEEIYVTSVVFGGLNYISQNTNAHYRWNNFGESIPMTFGELIVMNNFSRDFLFDPRVILQDERAIEYFHLQNVYENVSMINDLPKLFNQSKSMISQTLDKIALMNMRDFVISKVRQMRKSGLLTNIDIIRLLENKLKFDLSEEIIDGDN